MATRYSPRTLHGVLLLDKPVGITSNRALQIVKRAFRVRKAGHTGSLDPLATGMLPVCFGSAARLSQYLLDARKTYRARCTLGVATETGDAAGRQIATGPIPDLAFDEVQARVQRFLGDSDQVPPMYSALKHEGQRLYALARQGRTVTRRARRITVHAIGDVQLAGPNLEFTVVCSKGTYVRTLAEDIAGALGTVGHLSSLRRLAVGPFSADEMISLERIEAPLMGELAELDRYVLPMDRILPGWRSVEVTGAAEQRLRQGQAILAEPEWPAGRVKLYGPAGNFFGLGEVQPGRTLVPQRILAGLPLGDDADLRVE